MKFVKIVYEYIKPTFQHFPICVSFASNEKKSFWNVFFTINCEKRLTSLTILSKAWIHEQINFYEVLRQIYRWFKILHIILFITVKDH